LAVLLVFGQTLQHDFVNYDDAAYVVENRHVTAGLTVPAVVWAFRSDHASNWHPLTWLSHMLDCQMYGLNAGGHHLSNLLLHAASAMVLFLVLWRMTGDLWPGALVAALFAIHPLHVESVAWVAERKDVLSGLFFMLTLAAYVGYARHALSYARYLTVVVLFALGLMAKPVLVTLPFVLLLLDYWPLGRMRSPGMGPFPWRLVVEKIPLLALTIVSCVATCFAQSHAVVCLGAISVSSRIVNALISYVAYLGQFFYPVGLAAFYPHPGSHLPAWQVVGAFLLLAGVTVGVVQWRRPYPYLLVGWFWYLGMLVPMIGLVQVGEHARADRYTYLPQIGLCIALSWGAAQAVAAWRRHGGLFRAATVLAVSGMMVCAWQQTSYWSDSETLWTHTIACTAHNNVAHCSLGVALRQKGKLTEAIAEFQQALQIQPDDELAHCYLGVALRREGNTAEAIAHYRRAVELKPDYAFAHYNLAVALQQTGNMAEAIAHYQRVVEIEPEHVRAHCNLGAALQRTGKVAEAITHFQQAAQLAGNREPAVLANLAAAYAQVGRSADAVAVAQQALALASAQGDTALAEACRARIKLYQAGSPDHESPQQHPQ
jgi:Flp pilus assembly protein TadD